MSAPVKPAPDAPFDEQWFYCSPDANSNVGVDPNAPLNATVGVDRQITGQPNVKPMPPEPAANAEFDTKLAWLLVTHGYCELLDRVVKLFEPSEQCLITRPAFAYSRKPWHEVIPGPQGGKGETRYAVAEWVGRKERVKIRDLRMRPDRDFPTYREAGETFKNVYRRPQHAGAGEVQTFLDFIRHLLPVPFEQDYFLNWLAHKWRHPEIPGVAVIMVAESVGDQVFGTGRGMLRDIIQRLLGVAYVRPVEFDILTGKSSQAVFTDWLAGAIMIIVDESKDTADAGRWTERRAVYERLKTLIDPRTIERSFIGKNLRMFFGLCFAAFLIFTNNLDAIQIPPGDRRFGCLANGERMTAEMAKGLQAWMDKPVNIAALAQWLEARNIEKFDPFEAPETLTKTAMQELALTERDEAFTRVRALWGKTALFTGDQFMRAMMAQVDADAAYREEFRPWVRRRLRQAATTWKEEKKEFRMVGGKRDWILHWRDYDGPEVTCEEDARSAVAITEKLIDAKDGAAAALLRGLRVITGDGPPPEAGG